MLQVYKIFYRNKFYFPLFLGALVCFFPVVSHAQIQTAGTKEEVTNATSLSDLLDNIQSSPILIKASKTEKTQYSIMLPPAGKEHSSPLFCRLEDKINDGNQLQCLFRLGSVSYVNYLEQKGDHQRLMLEQLR